jgi:glycosyltransferase involved in cell wall biosynthesis
LSNLKQINRKVDPVCAIIPFYNEKETLKKILYETSKYVDHIFAVNDGSTDNLYIEESKIKGVEYIALDKNYGKGKALDVGFEKAISLGFKYVVTLDADLQHDPQYIPQLLDKLISYDIVIGNRLNNFKGMPLQRRASNKLTSMLLTVKTGQKILDSQCGFRAYRREVLEKVKTEYSGFEAESEILIKAARKKFRIGFTDIPTVYGNEKSKMRPLQAIFGFIKVLFTKVDE